MAFRIETALATRLPRDGTGRHTGFHRDEDIDLSDPQVHRQVCTRGFAGPEYDGTWTQHQHATLLVRLADGYDDPLAIWFAGMPFVTERHSQVFDISCDGVAIGQVRLGLDRADRQVLTFARPNAGIGDPWVRIDLGFRDQRSPEQEGLSGDTRPLGLKIGRLAVTAAGAPPPPLFEGPPITVGALPTVTPAPDAVARLEARTRSLDAKLDLVVEELRATRALAEQAQRSAGRVAAALARALAGPSGSDGG